MALASTASAPSSQAANIAKGFLELTEAPYNLAPGQAASTNVANMQTAVNLAYSLNLKLCCKGNSTGVGIPMNGAVYFEQDSVSGGIGGQGGGGASTRLFSHALQGRLVNGNRPHFVIQDGVTLANMTDIDLSGEPAEYDEGQYHCLFWFRQLDNGRPFKNLAASQYAAVLRNVKITVGANPSVCGVYFAGAQACFLADTEIDATGALSCIYELPGSGASVVNLHLKGGDYGVIQQDYRPTPHMNNCHFDGQIKAGLLMHGCRNGVIFQGCKFNSTSSGYSAFLSPQIRPLAGGNATNNNNPSFAQYGGYFMDCQVSMTGAAASGTAIDCYDGNIAIFDSYFDCARILHTAKRHSPNNIIEGSSGSWSYVKGAAHANQSLGSSVYVNGVEQSGPSANGLWLWETVVDNGSPPDSYISPWGWSESEIIHQFDDDVIEVTGTPNDNTANNSPVINSAIANSVNPAHADFGKTVFIGRGWWNCEDPIIHRLGAKVAGAGQSQTILQAGHQWQPTEPVNLYETEEGDAQVVHLQDIGLNRYEAKAGLSLGNLTAHENICIMSIKARIKAFLVQPCQHEWYGSGSGDMQRKEPLIRFSGKASGQFHSLPEDMLPRSGSTSDDEDYNHFKIEGLNSIYRLYLFDLNSEGGGASCQVRIDDAKGLYIGPFKAEAGINVPDHEPCIKANNSPGLIIFGASGNMSTNGLSDDSLYDLTACPGSMIVGTARQQSSDPGTKYNIQTNI